MRKFCYFIYFIYVLLYLPSAIGGENEPKRKLRFFCLDFHGAVSADIKDIFEKLGHEVVVWIAAEGIGYSCFTHGRTHDPVEVCDFHTWMSGDLKMYEDFYEKYKDYLNQFDGYIAAYNSTLSLLYEKLNKPIIIINALRYEFPFTNKPELRSLLDNFLINGVNSQRIFIVNNNKADQKYLKYYTGLDTEIIPSLCLYTKAKYTGNKNCFICQRVKKSELPRIVAERYSKLINNDLPFPYEWKDLYDYKGIIHFPYQVSTMSLFEEYSANVPLFFPSKKFLMELHHQHPDLISEASLAIHLPKESDLSPQNRRNLNNLEDPKVFQFWINNADFYDTENMPYIQYFDSFEHLKLLLEIVSPKSISENMKNHNKKRKSMVLKKWKSLLKKINDLQE